MTSRLAIGVSVLWIPLAFLFDGVTVLLLPTRLAGMTDPASAVGAISFVGIAAGLAVQPLAGLLTDRLRTRVDRRLVMVVVAVPTLAALWLLAGAQTVALVAGSYLVVQVAASILQSGQQTLIPEHIPAAARGRTGGLKTAFDLGGAFLAFLILGTLLAGGDATAAAGAISIVLVATLGLVWVLVPPTLGRTPPAPRASTGLPDGFIRLVTARFLFLLGTYGIGRFLLLLIADRLSLDPARATDETGAYLALFTLVGAVSGVTFGRLVDRVDSLSVMRLGAVLSAIGIVSLLPAAGSAGVLAAGSIMAVGTAAFVSANWAATTDVVPGPDAGRLMGIANFGTGGAAACAGLFGPLISAAGFVPAIVLSLVATLASLAPLASRASRRLAEAA
jgi:MFS family permease